MDLNGSKSSRVLRRPDPAASSYEGAIPDPRKRVAVFDVIGCGVHRNNAVRCFRLGRAEGDRHEAKIKRR